MKKIKILIAICLSLIIIYTLIYTILFMRGFVLNIVYYNQHPDMEGGFATVFTSAIHAFASLIACILSIIIFVYHNPRLFRRSTYTNLSEEWAKNKAEREARKAEKAQADKQKRIEELEKELDEMRKD